VFHAIDSRNPEMDLVLKSSLDLSHQCIGSQVGGRRIVRLLTKWKVMWEVILSRKTKSVQYLLKQNKILRLVEAEAT
jgi:hypothetical protein